MKTTILSVALILGTAFAANAQNVNIPDANFKAYLVGNALINTNSDAEIQVSEAAAFTGNVNCPSQGIADLTGIEAFTSLTKLYCYNNGAISSINVSNIPTLQHLFCSSNNLSTLDVSANPNLTFLACDDNELTSLNIANGNNAILANIYTNGNSGLSCIQVDDASYSTTNWTTGNYVFDTGVSFSENCSVCIVNIPDANFKAHLVGLNYINTNGDSEIQCSEAAAYAGEINCSNLSIANLTGIEAFTSIIGLWCFGNQLTTLDVTSNTDLTTLLCNSNQLTSLTVSNSALTFLNCHTNSLTTLNTSNCTALNMLFCYGNQLSALDLSGFPALTNLDCRNNQLTALDVSSNTGLQSLSVGGNYLSALNTSSNSALTSLACSANDLTTLNVTNNVNLTSLFCDNNQLTSLDIANLSWVTSLNVGFNQLTSLNVANGNNTNFTQFQAQGNNGLTCIQVDDAAYSTANWTGGNFMFDAQQDFDEDCGLGLNEEKIEVLNVYPNPVNELLNIELKANTTIQIVNVLGETIQQYSLTKGTNSIAVDDLNAGIYFILNQNGTKTMFVKR